MLISGGVDFENIEDETLLKSKNDASPFDWGEHIALLCAAYKFKPEYFLFEISIAQASRMLKNAAIAMGRPDLAGDDSAADNSFGKFRLVVKKIISRGKKASNG